MLDFHIPLGVTRIDHCVGKDRVVVWRGATWSGRLVLGEILSTEERRVEGRVASRDLRCDWWANGVGGVLVRERHRPRPINEAVGSG